MNNIEKSETQNASNGAGKTNFNSLPTSASYTEEIEKRTPPKKEIVATRETLPAQYEDSSEMLVRAASDSMTLLGKSATKLLSLMNDSVKDSDSQRKESGGMAVPSHQIENAVNCAHALASTIQIQVNMLKAVTSLVEKK